MNKRPNRDTYLTSHQVLGRIIDSSDKISGFLAHLRTLTDDSRTQLQVDQLIQLQNELTSNVASYRKQAPHKVSSTYMQYAQPGSGKIEEMIGKHREFTSLNDVTRTALALNEELAREIESVSLNEGLAQQREASVSLQDLVLETCRKISIARFGIDDM